MDDQRRPVAKPPIGSFNNDRYADVRESPARTWVFIVSFYAVTVSAVATIALAR